MKKILCVSLCMVLMLSVLLFPASATGATLIRQPDKTVFYEGLDWLYSGSSILPKTDFNLAGTVINYNGKDISFHVFPWGGNMIAEPDDGKWKVGKNNVKIFLDDFDNVYVNSQLTLVAIQKAELVKAPEKTDLVKGIDWDYDSLGFIALKSYNPGGAKIKLTFTDGTTATVAYEDGGMDWMVSDKIENFTLGSNTFELTYCNFKVPFTVNFMIEKLESIALKGKPSKQNYDFDSDWSYSKSGKIVPDYDYSGIKVTLTFTNGKSETVTYDSSPKRFTFTTPAEVKLGVNKIKATIDGKYSVDFEINIRGFGDINFDGQVNSNDALSVLQYSVNLIKLNIVKYNYADVNADDKVNSSDALAILQKSVGKIDYFKAELV